MKRLNKLWLCGIVIAGIGGFVATTTRALADGIVIHIGADIGPAPTPVVSATRQDDFPVSCAASDR